MAGPQESGFDPQATRQQLQLLLHSAPPPAPSPRLPSPAPAAAPAACRGWWPPAEQLLGAAPEAEGSVVGGEEAAVVFLRSMYGGYDELWLRSLLQDSGGDLAAAVEALATFELLAYGTDLHDAPPAPDTAPPAAPAPAPAPARQPVIWDREPAALPAPAPPQPLASAEAFPALEAVRAAPVLTKRNKKDLETLVDLFPYVARSTLQECLLQHGGDLQAASEALLAADTGHGSGPGADPGLPAAEAASGSEAGAGKQKRLDWASIEALVRRPPPRPWGGLLAAPRYVAPVRAGPEPEPEPEGQAASPEDMASAVKLRRLREQFPGLDPELLESVFAAAGCSLAAALQTLAQLFPPARSQPRPSASAPSPSPPSPALSTNRPARPASPADNGAAPARKPAPAATGGSSRFTVVERRKPGRESGSGPEPPGSGELARLAEQRNLLLRAAAQAYVAGNGARARQLADEGRAYVAMMREAHEQAARSALARQGGGGGGSVLEVDLHGLFVADALDVVQRVLQQMRERLRERGCGPTVLSIITGVGRHSAGGVAKIRPAVLGLLRQEGYAFSESRSGQILVRVTD